MGKRKAAKERNDREKRQAATFFTEEKFKSIKELEDFSAQAL